MFKTWQATYSTIHQETKQTVYFLDVSVNPRSISVTVRGKFDNVLHSIVVCERCNRFHKGYRKKELEKIHWRDGFKIFGKVDARRAIGFKFIMSCSWCVVFIVPAQYWSWGVDYFPANRQLLARSRDLFRGFDLFHGFDPSRVCSLSGAFLVLFLE